MKPLTMPHVEMCPECKIRPVQDGQGDCQTCRFRAAARASRERQRNGAGVGGQSPVGYLTPVKMRETR